MPRCQSVRSYQRTYTTAYVLYNILMPHTHLANHRRRFNMNRVIQGNTFGRVIEKQRKFIILWISGHLDHCQLITSQGLGNSDQYVLNTYLQIPGMGSERVSWLKYRSPYIEIESGNYILQFHRIRKNVSHLQKYLHLRPKYKISLTRAQQSMVRDDLDKGYIKNII